MSDPLLPRPARRGSKRYRKIRLTADSVGPDRSRRQRRRKACGCSVRRAGDGDRMLAMAQRNDAGRVRGR